MKWNRKYIAICSALFFILAAFLIVKGWQMPKEENVTQRGIEENMIEPSVTGSFIQENKTGEATSGSDTDSEQKKSKKQEKNTKKKSEKKSNVSESGQTETEKKNAGKKTEGQTKNKSSGKKSAEKGKTSSAETSKPAATPNSSKEEAGKEETVENSFEVSFQIDCIKILSQKKLWKEGIEEVIPSNGIFYKGTISFTDGETVYDLLKRICQENNIALDSQYTPLYGTYYVKGIGNLYEFDCGDESGWKYSVNGILPGVGSSNYKIKTGDNIQFFYDYQY